MILESSPAWYRMIQVSTPLRLICLATLALSTFQQALRAQGTVSINASASATPVARGFAGFSVEMSNSSAWAGTYSTTSGTSFDSVLPVFLNHLGAYEGPPVVRIGGNTQDELWLSTSTQTSPPAFAYATAPSLITFTLSEVESLGWIQRFTGCPFTIGLNMGGDLPFEALAELTAFQSTFDSGGILAFDIGNEPDVSNFLSYRGSGWSLSAYQANLLTFLSYLRTGAPSGTAFAAPAVAGTSWLPPTSASGFNALLAATGSQLAFITAHRYIANGQSPPADPVGTLYQPSNSSQIASTYAATQTAAKSYGLGLRINETNTFYNGGLSGVSNSFASSLWVADVLGSYATAGILGVNFHGGSGGPYSPFTTTASSGGYVVTANPVYYGMMAFAQFIQNGAGIINPTSTTSLPTTTSVYASRDAAGALRALVINKNQTSATSVTLTFTGLGSTYQPTGTLILLTAPSTSSTTGVTLGGQAYDTSGNLTGTFQSTSVAGSSGSFTLQLPAASAGIFTLDLLTPVAPSASVQVLSASLNAGAPAVFTGSVAGTAPFKVQWFANGSAITGATSLRYVIPAVTAANAGNYSLQVTSAAGTATSSSIALTVQGAPTITSGPNSVTVTSGSSASLSVMASGSGTLTYQWSFNGSALAGATNPTYTVTSATTANAGSYTVTVSNSAGSVTSSPATLTVNALPSASSTSGGGGGGGAPSLGCIAALSLLAALRLYRRSYLDFGAR